MDKERPLQTGALSREDEDFKTLKTMEVKGKEEEEEEEEEKEGEKEKEGGEVAKVEADKAQRRADKEKCRRARKAEISSMRADVDNMWRGLCELIAGNPNLVERASCHESFKRLMARQDARKGKDRPIAPITLGPDYDS